MATAYRVLCYRFCVCLLLLLLPWNGFDNDSWLLSPCEAWGKNGHEIIGNVAWMLLSNQTRLVIRSILNITAPNHNYDKENSHHMTPVLVQNFTSRTMNASMTIDCVGYCSPLADVANWADTVKYTKEYSWTSSLHYIDIHDDMIWSHCPIVDPDNTTDVYNNICHFNYTRDCGDGVCVAGAIVNYSHHLLSFSSYNHGHDNGDSTKRNSDKTIDRNNHLGLSSQHVSSQDKRRIQNLRPRLRRESLSHSAAFHALHATYNKENDGNSITPIYRNEALRQYDDKDVETRFLDEDSLLQVSLMFIIHFIGDIHQPLHCSRESDRGGNTIPVHFDASFATTMTNLKHGLNLHSVWDDTILEHNMYENYNNSRNDMELNLYEYIQTMVDTDIYNTTWINCPYGTHISCTVQWGEESLQYALQYSYRNNVDNTEIVPGTTLGYDYYIENRPIVQERLAVGAVRLALTLEYILRHF